MSQLFDTHNPPLAEREPDLPLQRGPDPLTLYAMALDKGVDPSRLEKLIDLHERLAKATAEAEFSQAMNVCQSEMPTVVRDAKNTQTGSEYATLEAVQKIAKPIYSKHGFSLAFGEHDCPLPNHKRTVCDVRHTGGHSERYHLDLPIDGIGPKGNAIGGMNAVQGSISTGSYGQRVLTCRIFNITIADTDKDGQRLGDPINEKQWRELEKLIQETGTDVPRFLAWVFNVDAAKLEDRHCLAAIPAACFGVARSELLRKRVAK